MSGMDLIRPHFDGDQNLIKYLLFFQLHDYSKDLLRNHLESFRNSFS
jgi:hypothetical protein